MSSGRRKIIPEFRTDNRKLRIRSVLEKRQSSLTIVAENINDRHNLSALLRSCDAVGIMEVQLLYHGSQNFPKPSESSSASAEKWLNLRKWNDVDECFEYLRKSKFKIYTTHLGMSSVSLYELDLTQPSALVFGNEHEGVSEKAVELADGNFLIPQVGIIRSLNISVACAVCLYEAYRQRLSAGMYEKPQLLANELAGIEKEWLSR